MSERLKLQLPEGFSIDLAKVVCNSCNQKGKCLPKDVRGNLLVELIDIEEGKGYDLQPSNDNTSLPTIKDSPLPEQQEGEDRGDNSIYGFLAGVASYCLFTPTGTKSPLCEFVFTGQQDVIVENVSSLRNPKLSVASEREVLAILTCFKCPLVSECNPSYLIENKVQLIVEGLCVNSEECCLTS
ncbi:MAG: hypothetical protein NZM26_01885 [Patescibacteria group bacterium]|nr:hypothetical protein [Patescibacteria group bacterium]